LWIDHIVYAVGDLQGAASRLLDEWGLASSSGGRHPAHGTENLIVPLGSDAYLEFVTVVDYEKARLSKMAQAVLNVVSAGGGYLVWAVRSDHVEAIAHERNLSIRSGARDAPGGARLSWLSAGPEQALSDPPLPFFIQWSVPDELHPGALAVEHRVAPTGIAWIELGCDSERIRAWLGGAELPIRCVEGPPTVQSVGVLTKCGELVLRL